jgi:hypothetical protein
LWRARVALHSRLRAPGSAPRTTRPGLRAPDYAPRTKTTLFARPAQEAPTKLMSEKARGRPVRRVRRMRRTGTAVEAAPWLDCERPVGVQQATFSNQRAQEATACRFNA